MAATESISPGRRRRLLRWCGWMHTAIFAVLLAVGSLYLVDYQWPDDALGVIYAVVAYVGQLGLIAYLPMLPVAALAALLPSVRLFRLLVPLLGAVILSFVLLDGLLFAERRFHLTPLTARLMEPSTWWFGLFYLAMFTAALGVIGGRIWRRMAGPAGLRGGRPVATTVVVCVLATQVLHIWADANYYVPITRFSRQLPLFRPASAKKLLVRWGLADLERNRERRLAGDLANTPESRNLDYPAAPLTCDRESGLNLVLILVDDIRADHLDDVYSPNAAAFAEDAIRFEAHYSGGNSSRMGVFSLFYGLSATYWDAFADTQRSPVLMDMLQEKGYALGIFSSAELYRPTEMDRTVFARVPGLRTRTEAEADIGWMRDRKIVEEWFQWLDGRDRNQPFFGFLFFDGPSDVGHPPGYDPPLPDVTGPLAADEDYQEYRREVRFADELVGRVLDDLRARGLLDDTVVIITSDHGEDFNEAGHGFYGHGTAYTRAQLHVPMVVHWPGREPRTVTHRTSHNDVPVALLRHLFGCTNPPSDYSSGNGLFDGEPWDWLVIGSYSDFALVEPHRVTIVLPGGHVEVRDDRYRMVEAPDVDDALINEALIEMSRFYE